MHASKKLSAATNMYLFAECRAFIMPSLMMCLLNFCNSAYAGSVSGTMSVPTGVAPASGIRYAVTALLVTDPLVQLNILDIIEEGASGDDFQVTIPDDGIETWQLRYLCNEDDCEQ